QGPAMHDDLTAPLGQDQVRGRASCGRAIILAAVLGSAGLAAALASSCLERIKPQLQAAFKSADNSLAPEAEIQKPMPSAGRDASESKQESGAQPSLQLSAPSGPACSSTLETGASESQSGVKIVRAGGEGAPDPLIIDVAKALGAAATGADPQIIEQSRYGPVPRIGINGAKPSKVYARPDYSSGGVPRIALVVCGLGLAAQATETAISTLPGEVTLGFAPYASDLSRQTALARGAGHEVVLQIPMEPFDYPRNNPGPH